MCLDEIGHRGYACQSYVLDAAWYGLPQSRRRVYIVCIAVANPDVSIGIEAFFQSVESILRNLQFTPPPAATRHSRHTA